MAKRAATTLLLITSQTIARADFGPEPELSPLGLWHTPARRETGWPESVRAALALGPRCARDVWLLTDHVWTQRVYFAAPVMDGLSDEQRQRAIGFEVESFSGIPALNSRLGVHRLGVAQGSEAFWVTQIQGDEADEINQDVFARGGVLRGIAHPGGLPAPLLAPNKAESFSRVEVWSRATLCVEKVEEQVAQVRVINAGPSQQQWHESVEAWLARVAAPYAEWLTSVESGPSPSAASRGEDFLFAHTHPIRSVPPLAEEALKDFLGMWARELSAPVPRVPIIAAPPSPVHLGRLAVAAAVLLAVAIVGSAVHYLLLHQQLGDAQSQLAALTHVQKQKAELAARTELAKKQLQQLTPGHPPRTSGPEATDEIRRQQDRWAALLAVIADSTGNEVVLDGLTGQPGGEVCVDGTCLRPTAADELAARMSLALAAKGWRVGAAEKRECGTGAQACLWQYRILVSPPVQSPAPATTSSRPTVKPGA